MEKNRISRFFYIVGIVTTIMLISGLIMFAILKISMSESSDFSYDDGPYIVYLNDSTIKTLTVKVNTSDTLILERIISRKDTSEIRNLSGIYTGFNPFEKFQYSNVSEFKAEKIGAISDIHGSYHHFKQLLQSNKIIDDSQNWNWGKGHLVIIGDVLDKGPYVSECLWLIRKLEKQAEAQGGQVHFLLGNHERLVLSGDCNYVNGKYREICKLLSINYNQLFNNDTYWGSWLRSKNIIIKINDNLFTHGGLSELMLNKKYTLTQINKYINDWINASNPATFDEKTRSNLSFIINYFGPLEYRGYYDRNVFNRGQKSTFPEKKIDDITKFYDVTHLIVGHTVVTEVKGLFNNKVIAINTRYPKDDVVNEKSHCQMLIIEDGKYYKADLNGDRYLIFADQVEVIP
jgi:hypothetical protein